MPILVNFDSYCTYRHFARARNVYLDKTQPACQWDDDIGRSKVLEFFMVTFSYNHIFFINMAASGKINCRTNPAWCRGNVGPSICVQWYKKPLVCSLSYLLGIYYDYATDLAHSLISFV